MVRTMTSFHSGLICMNYNTQLENVPLIYSPSPYQTSPEISFLGSLEDTIFYSIARFFYQTAIQCCRQNAVAKTSRLQNRLQIIWISIEAHATLQWIPISLWYSCPVLQSSHLTETQWIYRNFIGWETKPGHIIYIAPGHDKQEIPVICELV